MRAECEAMLSELRNKQDIISRAIYSIEAMMLALYGSTDSPTQSVEQAQAALAAQCANVRHRGDVGAKY